jgi:transcriptional antiterminator RfaH
MPFSSGLISFDTVPATVPDSLIQAIRRHLEEVNAAGGEQFVGLKRGDVVVIQGGPFDGYEAIFDACLTGNERVRVLLKFLRARQLSIELPAAQIQRLRQKRR